MRRTFSILTAVILAAIVTSCLHKDVSSGTADDVICTYIVHRDGKAALVNLETVFQASSKQYNGGMRITGYEDFRITVIRIDTGEITARKKVGKRFVHVIALSGEDIWLYNRKQGLYSLDLITLELSHTRDDISKANPSLSDTLVQPEWNEAAKYYGYDPATERIIITDTQGVRYQLDPVSLEVSPHTGEFTQASVSPYDDYFDGSIRYPSGTLSLEGGLRKTISFNGQTVAGSDAFIEGSFIVFEHERISLENAEKTGRRNQSDTDRARHLKNTVKILTELVNDPATPSPIVEKSLEILQGLTDQLETLEESIQEKTAGTDLPEAVYIAHKESLSPDAFMQISRITLSDGSRVKLEWTVTLPGIYFDTKNAYETNPFRLTFSKGNPDYSYQYFNTAGDSLVFVYMLHAGSIDINTGKPLWVKRL